MPEENNPQITVTELVAQVKILVDSQQISLQRMEQAFNVFQDRAQELASLADQLVSLKSNLEIGLEALHRSISENDSQIDDLAKITVRIGQMEQTYQQATIQAQQG